MSYSTKNELTERLIYNLLQPKGLISAFCVDTWDKSAILVHSISTGISYPYLYLKFAAS